MAKIFPEKIIKDGKEVEFRNIADAINQGVMYLTEDRKGAGLNLIDDIRHKHYDCEFASYQRSFLINENEEIKVANEYRKRLNIRSTGILQAYRYTFRR